MTITLILISLGIAFWLAFILMAIVLPIKPDAVKITEKLVCPEGNELIIQTAAYSYHRPGQRALEISYRDKNGTIKNAMLKVMAIFWMMLFVISLPITLLLVVVINNSIQVFR
jgi:hypothetical protein